MDMKRKTRTECHKISKWNLLWLLGGSMFFAGCGSRSPERIEVSIVESALESEDSLQTKGILVIDALEGTEESIDKEQFEGLSVQQETVTETGLESETESSAEETGVCSAAPEVTASADLTKEQIEVINTATWSNPASGCYDVLSVSDLTREEVQNWILSAPFPEGSWCNGHALTPEEQSAIEANRNLDAIPEKVSVQYGILTDNADVRIFPTDAVLQTEVSPQAFDYMQESLFLIGEMVAVLHTSADGTYVYVIGGNDKGWIARDCVGLTEHGVLQQWQEGLRHPAVVIEPYVKVEGLHTFRMGTAFPLLEKNDTTMRISYPVNRDGRLELTEMVLPVENDISDGYLPYTYEAAAQRMQQMVGAAYGWGDVHLNYDCSSTVGAVYRCFGIFLPRNTGNMAATGAVVISLEQMGTETRDGLIRSLPAGSLLLMKGHVAMYMGIVNGEPRIAHTVSRYSGDGANLMDIYSCVETSLYIYTDSLKPYEETLTYVISF